MVITERQAEYAEARREAYESARQAREAVREATGSRGLGLGVTTELWKQADKEATAERGTPEYYRQMAQNIKQVATEIQADSQYKTWGGTLEENIKGFADKHGMSLESATRTLQAYNKNPNDPQFKNLGVLTKYELSRLSQLDPTYRMQQKAYEKVKDYIEVGRVTPENPSGITGFDLRSAVNAGITDLSTYKLAQPYISFKITQRDINQAQKLEIQPKQAVVTPDYSYEKEISKAVSELPQELRLVYKTSGGDLEALNTAIEEYNRNIIEQKRQFEQEQKLYNTAIAKLENNRYQDSEGKYRIARYLRDNPNDKQTLINAGFTNNDIKQAQTFNLKNFGVGAEKQLSEREFTKQYFAERGWKYVTRGTITSTKDLERLELASKAYDKKYSATVTLDQYQVNVFEDKGWEIVNPYELTSSAEDEKRWANYLRRTRQVTKEYESIFGTHAINKQATEKVTDLVPGVYLAKNWNKLSDTEKAINIAIDTIFVTAILGKPLTSVTRTVLTRAYGTGSKLIEQSAQKVAMSFRKASMTSLRNDGVVIEQLGRAMKTKGISGADNLIQKGIALQQNAHKIAITGYTKPTIKAPTTLQRATNELISLSKTFVKSGQAGFLGIPKKTLGQATKRAVTTHPMTKSEFRATEKRLWKQVEEMTRKKVNRAKIDKREIAKVSQRFKREVPKSHKFKLSKNVSTAKLEKLTKELEKAKSKRLKRAIAREIDAEIKKFSRVTVDSGTKEVVKSVNAYLAISAVSPMLVSKLLTNLDRVTANQVLANLSPEIRKAYRLENLTKVQQLAQTKMQQKPSELALTKILAMQLPQSIVKHAQKLQPKLQTKQAVKPQTALTIDSPATIRRPVNKIPKTPVDKVPRVKPRLPLQYMAEEAKGKDKKEKDVGIIAWKQGVVVIAVYYPYKSKKDVKVYHYKHLPPELEQVRIHKGIKSAMKSLTLITGKAPERLTLDLGIQDVIIKGKSIRFVSDPEQKTVSDIDLKRYNNLLKKKPTSSAIRTTTKRKSRAVQPKRNQLLAGIV